MYYTRKVGTVRLFFVCKGNPSHTSAQMQMLAPRLSRTLRLLHLHQLRTHISISIYNVNRPAYLAMINVSWPVVYVIAVIPTSTIVQLLFSL